MSTMYSYTDIAPSDSLKDYIKCYWEFKIDTIERKTFDILPDGFFDLIVTVKDNRITSNDLTGIWDKTIRISYNSTCRHIGIRFKPICVHSLFKQSIRRFLNSSIVFDLQNFNIEKGLLLNPANSLDFFSSYFNKLFENLINFEKTDSRIIKFYNCVDSTHGTSTIENTARQIGFSSRQINRIVSNDLGISSKTYVQIIRLNETLKQINANNLMPNSYFFDQSHLIKNLKHFTGITPKEFVSEKNVRFLQYHDF